MQNIIQKTIYKRYRRSKSIVMDNTDLEILQVLQKKARIPNVEVARTIGMAPSAVLERIKKLEVRGVINGYEVRLNPDMFNCAMIAFIRIKVANPAQIDTAGDRLSQIDQVQEVHHVCYILRHKRRINPGGFLCSIVFGV